MSDLIRRSDALKAIANDGDEHWWYEERINEVPAVDAVEVVHGRWIEEYRQTWIPVEYDKDGEPILHDVKLFRCNLCGRIKGKKEPFCNCGARMDLEE